MAIEQSKGVNLLDNLDRVLGDISVTVVDKEHKTVFKCQKECIEERTDWYDGEMGREENES